MILEGYNKSNVCIIKWEATTEKEGCNPIL
jgi:hypothetical protein